jgi:hypothetical protein
MRIYDQQRSRQQSGAQNNFSSYGEIVFIYVSMRLSFPQRRLQPQTNHSQDPSDFFDGHFAHTESVLRSALKSQQVQLIRGFGRAQRSADASARREG